MLQWPPGMESFQYAATGEQRRKIMKVRITSQKATIVYSVMIGIRIEENLKSRQYSERMASFDDPIE